MNAQQRGPHPGCGGYAVLTVTIFAFIIILAGAAIFVLASYETKGAIYRQNSSEAFYLADGAVERARAKFLESRAWRDGWSDEAAGRGTYDLAVTDTTYAGETDVVQLISTGHVQNGDRKIEVMARVPPTALGLAILVWDADVRGNLCLDGGMHVNDDDPNFGPNDVFLSCDDDYTKGFIITPPYMYTEPGYYPNATYYYVRGSDLGGVYHGRIYDRLGNDITSGDSLRSVTSFDSDDSTFTFDFDDPADFITYFDDATGLFARDTAAGDIAVVVNFGEPPLIGPPGFEGTAHIVLDGDDDSVVHPTIINTRYIGPPIDSCRVVSDYWKGGVTELRQCTFEPYYGLAMLVDDVDKPGTAHTYVGTETWPALMYVTGDIDKINSQFHLIGSLICLGTLISEGGPDVIYSDGFIGNLPPWLQEDWPDGVSGTLKVLRWREIAALE